VRITGLRNPCAQINTYADGLLSKVLGRDENGDIVRRAGIMGVVEVSGDIAPGDPIAVEAPPGPHHPLEYV
jgi:MOSC domain-containing protein YiiM